MIEEWNKIQTDCQHYNNCRNPSKTCNSHCERLKCKDRAFGVYRTKAEGRVVEDAEFTPYGWKAKWSKRYQNDSDFEFIERSRVMSEEMITIKKSEYDKLIDDQNFLWVLEAVGVDGWDGYDHAKEIFEDQE
jgi:hypothetical protein